MKFLTIKNLISQTDSVNGQIQLDLLTDPNKRFHLDYPKWTNSRLLTSYPSYKGRTVALKLRNARNTNDEVLSVSGLYSVYLEYTNILLVIDIWCHKMHSLVRTQVRGVTVYWIRSQMQTRACPQMPLINWPIKCSAVKCTLYLECTLHWTLYSYCLNLIIYRMNCFN